MDKSIIFKELINGKILSLNSKKHGKMASYLNDDENFEEFNKLLKQIGYVLNAKEGAFYLSKELTNSNEIDTFVNKYKRAFVAIAILRMVYESISRGNIITISNFIHQYKNKNSKEIEELFSYLTNKKEDLEKVETLFYELSKYYVIEKLENSKEQYIILDAMNYYLSILDDMEFSDD